MFGMNPWTIYMIKFNDKLWEQIQLQYLKMPDRLLGLWLAPHLFLSWWRWWFHQGRKSPAASCHGQALAGWVWSSEFKAEYSNLPRPKTHTNKQTKEKEKNTLCLWAESRRSCLVLSFYFPLQNPTWTHTNVSRLLGPRGDIIWSTVSYMTFSKNKRFHWLINKEESMKGTLTYILFPTILQSNC